MRPIRRALAWRPSAPLAYIVVAGVSVAVVVALLPGPQRFGALVVGCLLTLFYLGWDVIGRAEP